MKKIKIIALIVILFTISVRAQANTGESYYVEDSDIQFSSDSLEFWEELP